MKKNNKKGPSYLDLAEFMMSGPFSPKLQTRNMPLQVENLQVLNFQQLENKQYLACRVALFLIFSYLQESHSIEQADLHLDKWIAITLSKRASGESWERRDRIHGFYVRRTCTCMFSQNESDEHFEQEEEEKQMSAIQQQQQQQKSSHNEKQDKQSKFQYNPEEYIPNMHLLELDTFTFTHEQFAIGLEQVQGASEEDRRQYISLYLTDEDLQNFKEATLQELIQVVRWNLSKLGIITRLERKSKVARYIQKKKKRIWKKKINYDCRKRVADNRLRIKGKFVTREQACEILGVELTSFQNLKKILMTKNKIF